MSDELAKSAVPPAAYQLGEYGGSRNYELLATLALQQSIICIVDYDNDIRDVARTIYQDHHGNGCWNVSSRGMGYITAFSKDEFLAACKRKNLEFIEPR